jgi:NAD-dependent protein deacetylase/lipoamidase
VSRSANPSLVRQLAALIRSRQPCVVLTGAGVSTESGIPDFRSRGGIWERYDPMEYATIDAFRRDPVKVWDFYAKRLSVLRDARPNRAHLALAELEREGLVEAVVTQNIDRLHRKAGSERVIEVHGSIDTSSCTSCSARYSLERVAELFGGEGIATCAECGGKVKPDVVLFGELLPEAAIAEAQDLCASSELLLCVGSSLEVYPVAGLPALTLDAGGRVAIVTQGPTPYDPDAAVRLGGDVVEELEALLAAL